MYFHGIAPGDLGVFALGLVIAGAVGGLTAGVLGIGGGIVLVPVLFHVMAALGVDPAVRIHLTIGTSLAAIIPAAIIRARNTSQDVDWAVVRRWTAPTIAGVVPGAVIAALEGEHVLVIAFAVVALMVVLGLGTDFRLVRLGRRYSVPALTGFFAAMTGIGGDAPGAIVLQHSDLSQRQAVATASVVALAVAVPGVFAAILFGRTAGALPPGSVGYFNLVAFALTAPVLLPAEMAGAALAHVVDVKRFRWVFTALVVITTARMVWDAWA